jgi:serine/threonine-protein kinase
LLVERAGEAAAGPVFKAIALDRRIFGRVVAVRCMTRALGRSSALARRLAEEARLCKLLDHPHILRTLDFGNAGGTFFVATPYVEGRDLGSVIRALRRGRLALQPGPVAQIALWVARGLAFAHGLADKQGRPYGIVHRNINPSTLLLTDTGGVKIAEFGAADVAESAGRVQTPQRQLQRRVRYFSPEQARGEPVDRRSDVFSLGVVMWELLTGHRLFGAATAFECIGNVLHAPIVAPSARRRAVPDALDRIVLRALQRDRGARYDSADALAAELQAFLGTQRMRPDAVRYILGSLFGGEEPPPRGRGQDRAAAARDDEDTVAVGPSWGASDPLVGRVTPTGSTQSSVEVPAPGPARRRAGRRLQRWAVTVGLVLAGVCAAYGVLHARARPRTPAPPAALSASAVAAPTVVVVPAALLPVLAPEPPVVVIAADPIARARPAATASAPAPRRLIKRRGRPRGPTAPAPAR